MEHNHWTPSGRGKQVLPETIDSSLVSFFAKVRGDQPCSSLSLYRPLQFCVPLHRTFRGVPPVPSPLLNLIMPSKLGLSLFGISWEDEHLIPLSEMIEACAPSLSELSISGVRHTGRCYELKCLVIPHSDFVLFIEWASRPDLRSSIQTDPPLP